MKTFRNLLEVLKKSESDKVVFDKKIQNLPVVIKKENGVFVVFIDNDRLDAYKTQQQAEKMAKEFITMYKGKNG